MVVCARLPNKPNMRGQNSLMSLVFWFPCWKNTNTSVQTKFLNDKLFDTFLNHNFTVRESNWNQGGGACNCAHQFLTYMKSRCMTYFVLLDPYRCSVKVVETWGVERFIQGNLDMYLLTAFWLIDQVKNWDYFDCVCWSCGEVCRVLVSNKVNQIQEVTSGVYRSLCTLIPWA